MQHTKYPSFRQSDLGEDFSKIAFVTVYSSDLLRVAALPSG
jgi:hypothetical protein